MEQSVARAFPIESVSELSENQFEVAKLIRAT